VRREAVFKILFQIKPARHRHTHIVIHHLGQIGPLESTIALEVGCGMDMQLPDPQLRALRHHLLAVERFTRRRSQKKAEGAPACATGASAGLGKYWK
jgi:hypothetical protein